MNQALCVALLLNACGPAPTDSTTAREPLPVLVAAGHSYSRIAAGFVHTCGLAGDGKAFCWGDNQYSQLGAEVSDDCGGLACSRRHVAAAPQLRFTFLAAGWVHNCGVASDTYIYCWGGGAIDKRGYLGDGSLQRSATPVRVASDSLFTAVTLGDGHSCALTASGMAFCWGQNTWGQIGDGTSQDRPTPVAVNTALRFRSLSAGANHTCGVTRANDVYCWGDNRWGELGSGTVAYGDVAAARRTPTKVAVDREFVVVAGGWEHTCALDRAGVAYCWGRNDDARQLGDDSDVAHRGEPARVAGAVRFVDLWAGPLSTCGRTASNDVYCWGANYYGGLGNGEIAPGGVGHPVRTLGGPYVQVSIGQGHTCAVATDQRLWCWGDQSAGQF